MFLNLRLESQQNTYCHLRLGLFVYIFELLQDEQERVGALKKLRGNLVGKIYIYYTLHTNTKIIPILYLNVSTSNLGDFGLGTCCMHARMKIS